MDPIQIHIGFASERIGHEEPQIAESGGISSAPLMAC